MWSRQKLLEFLSGREVSLDNIKFCFHKIKKHLRIAVFNEKVRIRLTFVIKFSRKTNAKRFRRFDDILSIDYCFQFSFVYLLM